MRVAVLGDSWALKGAPAMHEVLEPLGYNVSVSFARGGALACMLAQFPAEKWGVDATDFVWLSSGINDIKLARQPGERADELPSKFVECHVMLLRNLFRANPALHVVHFGYDLLCSPSFLRPACVRCGWGAPANASLLVEDQCDDDGIRNTAECFNRMTRRLQRSLDSINGLHRLAQRTSEMQLPRDSAVFRSALAAGGSYTVLDLQGALQAEGGMDARVGRPDLASFSPAKFYQPDCLHPNQDGMRILMRRMAERYFQKRWP